MTLANKVTIARILLIPLFVLEVLNYQHTGIEWHRWSALALFLTASLSDALDGYIARRFNQRSRLGAVLDPMADKILLVVALILLSRSGFPHQPPLPFWLLLVVLSRDIILTLGWAVIHFTCGQARVRPNLLGKSATVLQMVIIVLSLTHAPATVQAWTAIAATVLAIVSCVVYARDGLQQLSASPLSGPDADQPPSRHSVRHSATAARTRPGPPS